MSNEITTTVIAALVDEVIAESERRLIQNCGLLSTMRISDLLGKPAKSAEFPIWERTSGSQVSEVAEGTDHSTNTPVSVTAKTASIDEHVIKNVITDLSAGSSLEDITQTITQKFSSAMQDRLELDITSLFQGFSGNASGSSATSPVSVDHFYNGILQLREADAPMDQVVAVLSPKQWWGNKGLRTALEASDVAAGTDFGTSFLRMGGVANPFGIPVFVCNNVLENSNVATGSIYVANGALGLATKGLMNVEFERDASLRGFELVATGRWGEIELVDAWGLRLYSDVS